MGHLENDCLKDGLIDKLREYGDPISSTCMHTRNLKNNLEFLEKHGTKENSEERAYMIAKLMKVINCNHIYKNVMTESLDHLGERVSLYEYYDARRKLINNLIVLGYKKNYLKNLNVETLHKLIDNPNPYVKSNRRELIDLLSSSYGMSPSTLKSWNFHKIKDAFRKKMSKKYGPLGEPLKVVASEPSYKQCGARSDYLRSLSNALFYEIVYDA